METEPIIELPESPPPQRTGSDDEEERREAEAEEQEEQAINYSGRVEDVSNAPGQFVQTHGHASGLGAKPRKPIRTHQASPLATMGRSGHSTKRFV